MRADGSVRRLGPASRAADFVFEGTLYASAITDAYPINNLYVFSPDGRRIVFTDLGPGPTGEEEIQIVTLEVSTGARTVIRLPAATPPKASGRPAIFLNGFIDNETIRFFSNTNPDELNPDGDFLNFEINTDGTNPRRSITVPLAGLHAENGELVPILSITPGATIIFTSLHNSVNTASELYSLAGENLLQLTNFGRADTGYATLSMDGQRAFFSASADPFGANPTENCQIFSIDTLGGNLCQLTSFRAGDHSESGCFPSPDRSGCYVFPGAQEPQTQSLPFTSTCDPLGMNPNGEQIFAVRPDGTGVRQLTDLAGVATAADGSIDVELPGPNVP